MIRILELFGGIGACSKALERLGIEHEIVDVVEIDKYAIKSFNAIHNTNFEPQDITQWDKDIEVDLIMHGSPCQDFSLAGKQAGGDKDSGTRSSLMYETIRIVEKLKPKYVIWENVKNLLSKKHIHNFNAYLEAMKQLGYTNYYQVLNAKDYGIPQNRERVFTISILKESIVYDDYNSNIRKDQDTIGTLTTNCGSSTIRNGWKIIKHEQHFEFPLKQELKLKLKDMLEDEVDDKYYLSDKMIKYISANNEKWTGNNDKSSINKSIASAINTGEGSRRCDASNYVSNNFPGDTEKSKHQAGSVYDENGLSPTLDTMQGGWRQPCIEIKEATKQGYKEAYEGDGVNISSRMKYQRGNVQKESIQTITTSGGNERGVVVNKTVCLNSKSGRNGVEGLQPSLKDRIYDSNGIATCCATSNFFMPNYTVGLRIRKLTPKECWRLMGFDDEDFERASEVNSNTQLYKQAGNSIVVNVLEAILCNLLLENNNNKWEDLD